MRNDTLLTQYDTTQSHEQSAFDTLIRRDFFFHDIRVTCQTNHLAIMAILERMLAIFPVLSKPRGTATYTVLCHEQATQFAPRLPSKRLRLDTVRLLTNTRLKYYASLDKATEFQSFVPLPSVNAAALTCIATQEHAALTQIELPERYQDGFLRRYVFLLALGQLMNRYGFHPCHAAAITAPWDARQGALLLGDSGSGKTTLSLGCATSGCGLLGDDLVMLREQSASGLVDACAIADEVSVRSGSLDLWPALAFLREYPADQRDKRYCTIEQIRQGAWQPHTTPRLLLFPTLIEGNESSIARLGKAVLFQELVDQCVSKNTMSSQAQEQFFWLLGKLVEQAAGYRIAIARGATDGPEIVRSLFAEANQ